MTINRYWIMPLMTCLISCSKVSVPAFQEAEHLPAGGMTGKGLSDRSFVQVGRNVDRKEELKFWTGFSLFRDPWVIAPSSTRDRDGLGPLFNTRSCISCHSAGGKGPAPAEGLSKPSALVIRLGSAQHGLFVDPVYGGQIQPRAIAVTHSSIQPDLVGEARLDLRYQQISGQYADGTSYTLRQPTYDLTDLAYGELDKRSVLSPRFSPVIYGVGLLDAISAEDLLSQEDINDNDQDGISGKYNRVPIMPSRHNTAIFHQPIADLSDTLSLGIGRFGHKAKQPSLHQQVAAAFRDDIGITNTSFETESCSIQQKNCQAASAIGGHQSIEIPDKLLDLVTQFNQLIAVPPARGINAKQVQQGRDLFYKLGCESCHTASYTTDVNYPHPRLANQKIWPYTDLALHDMGEGLADGVNEYDANGQEWRTPPLWGIGARKSVREENLFLHDGRAQTVAEAILWHGGEALTSQQSFIQLDLAQRSALLAFLDAI
ncbi:di-heme oxidoredictase family protein [Paraglaciecola aquimarina]|uniref:Di-heme oxidoredictase family protein n=1 Tax=Paraglaciecola aquimarina TaxID=1235557 RepID=A0ABU3SVK2_9ALTE|nr:di-heme oxidoredictase family protein [Paraglaciecola aquimarina]MDU0354018.1 di-heme oxidoredictase family protein [Paraglaciecola aquimarina]